MLMKMKNNYKFDDNDGVVDFYDDLLNMTMIVISIIIIIIIAIIAIVVIVVVRGALKKNN